MYLKKILMVFGLLLVLGGCESVKLKTLEQLGYEKRDILTGRIEKAKDSQEEAKEQFASALEEFQSVVKFDGGELEAVYNRLNEQFKKSQQSAQAVSDRIDSVEYVAEKLFDEWQTELSQYSSASLKQKSQLKLNQTKKRYAALIKTMKKVEKKMQPVLAVFQDQVLYLKHNLNARAIDAIKEELSGIKKDVSVLIKQMNQSISESNQFIKQMEN
ncbi:DUF2959 domain-containing protein [Aliikangiella maris]|uniref:DUF2959 domain-containing protein n=2 Tax=Aliikangiella maris TaxID=3162458 RepID=A0ABV3MUJ8_9GAMM